MSSRTHVMIDPLTPPQFSQMHCLIVFVDLTNFTSTARQLDDWQLAALVQQYYQRTTEIIENAGGQLVKFIGDAALIIFSEDRAETGILTMLRYQQMIDSWLKSVGYPGRIIVKAHFGEVIAGEFGGTNSKRFDIIGAQVNLTATLESRGFALSAQAFRTLGAEARKQFKKHTPPISYIPVEQSH